MVRYERCSQEALSLLSHVCYPESTGRATHPPLQLIPVGSPFHRIGVDILQLPPTYDGNKYVVIFLDYLTKWVKAFAVKDQQAETVARLLVEEVVCRYGAPERLLSDQGSNFRSDLIAHVCHLLKIQKVNTLGYHPQTDGLIERFHQTLITMLSMYVEKHRQDWDHYLPYMLYAYRITVQESTHKSPFFLMFGRDPCQPTDEALSCPTTPYMIDLDDYKSELVQGLSDAWEVAAKNIESAQGRQKTAYDRRAKVAYKIGDRVMVHMPHESTGKAAKLARPYFGPYRILGITPTNAEVRLVDRPDDPAMFVSLSRVRPCYTELPDVLWSGHSPRKSRKKRGKKSVQPPTEATSPMAKPYTGPTTRSRSKVLSK